MNKLKELWWAFALGFFAILGTFVYFLTRRTSVVITDYKTKTKSELVSLELDALQKKNNVELNYAKREDAIKTVMQIEGKKERLKKLADLVNQ